MNFRLTTLLFLCTLAGCSTVEKILTPPPTMSSHVSTIADNVHSAGGLELLSWVGGISALAGIAAMVLTRGSMGLRAIIAGCCLVILNFAIANYLSWILIPVLVSTGCVSLCWAYITIRKLMNKERCNG